MELTDKLERVRAAVSAEEWERRLSEADRQAATIERICAHVADGMKKRPAIRAEAPDDPETTWVARMRRYARGGRDALISHKIPVRPKTKVTDEVVGVVRGLLRADSSLRAPAVAKELEGIYGTPFSESSVKRAMKRAGVSQPPGRPSRQETVERHPLAGAELLLAVDQELGATAKLGRAVHKWLKGLPEPDGEVRDDQSNRDDKGCFTAEYNASEPRTEPELGEKFDSVELRRRGKNLPAMRVAQTSQATLVRKLRALMMLPVVTDSPRWDALRHWQGQQLEALVGIAYMPSTLDKMARELKYAGAAAPMREAVAQFWLGRGEVVSEELQGAVMLYADTATKPVWTHHFTRCAKVAKLGGRVMPATSTVFLNAGTGTPVLYRSFSGHVSLPTATQELLESYERIAGEGTARRIVVMDREAHAAWFMKALDAGDWQFVVPLRQNVTGPNAVFEDVTPWAPYGDRGDRLRGGRLRLNDSKDRSSPLWVRVVARERHRTGNIAWYATNVDHADLSDTAVLDAYFDRWPLQEHVFRDGNGRVHLDAHHGYGKRKTDNVAVIDRADRFGGQLERCERAVEDGRVDLVDVDDAIRVHQRADERVRATLDRERAELDTLVDAGETTDPRFVELYDSIGFWGPWVSKNRRKLDAFQEQRDTLREAIASEKLRAEKLRSKLDRLDRRRRIFTVDTELDQIMTALKITFMNLCAVLMTRYFGGRRLQLDTLIRAVLTLPGERVLTPSTETIRIYRHDRDRELMPLVEATAEALTARGLKRGFRKLRFEVVDPPPTRSRRAGGGDDTG